MQCTKGYSMSTKSNRVLNPFCNDRKINYILLPPATKLRQGYIFTGVCDSVHREGGVPGQVHPPLGPGTPPSRDQVHPPGTRYIPRTRYTPWDQVHPPGTGTPPRSSACWEIQATSRRYASYWNAFLLSVLLLWTISCLKTNVNDFSSVKLVIHEGQGNTM